MTDVRPRFSHNFTRLSGTKRRPALIRERALSGRKFVQDHKEGGREGAKLCHASPYTIGAERHVRGYGEPTPRAQTRGSKPPSDLPWRGPDQPYDH